MSRFQGMKRARILTATVVVMMAAAGMAIPVSGADGPAPPSANLIVGFHERQVNATLLASFGGLVLGSSASLGLAAVYAPNATAFAALAAVEPSIAFVDTNDAIQADSSGWDSSGWDSSGWDSSGWDSSGWDSSGWDSSGWDSSGWDESKAASSGWDSSGWDSSGWDSSGWDSSGWDSSGWDSSGWDSSGWDSSGWDSSGWDSSGWDSAQMTALGAGSPLSPAGTDPLVAWQWGLAATNASRANTLSGSGSRVICIVDSGVDHTHPDLSARMWRATDGTVGYDFVNRDSNPMDDAGHGTHVAGIAAAATGNRAGIAGMSNAKIMAVKVLAANGVGQEIDLAFGIEWCADHGADVISMSLGTPENSRPVHRAVVDAFAQGIVLVASVGNTGASCDCVRYPAAYPQVLAVGAVRPNGQVAPFSAISHGVDFAAPGYAILSTMPGSRYATLNGTSQAVPYVSAAMALLLDARAGMTAADAAEALRDTALDMGPDGKDMAYGYGVVNLGAALAAARAG